MKTTVEGVTIDLTPDQIALIEKVKAERDASCKSFASVLRHFGFRKRNSWSGLKHEMFFNKRNGWVAEIYQRGVATHDCWMAGTGLPNLGFPGGKIYDTPEQVSEALAKALNEIGGTK